MKRRLFSYLGSTKRLLSDMNMKELCEELKIAEIGRIIVPFSKMRNSFQLHCLRHDYD